MKYYCLFEDGQTTQNECELDTLREVISFTNELFNYDITINDIDYLIKTGKFDKVNYNKNERILIRLKREEYQ